MSQFDDDNMSDLINTFEKNFARLPAKLNEAWSHAVQFGWYPTPYMPAKPPKISLQSQHAIDTKMSQKFEEKYLEAKEFILSHAKNREHILSVALSLHEQANYIASIPLLLAQSDGVFEEYLGLSAFTRKESKLKNIEIKVNNAFTNEPIAKAYFVQFAKPSQYSEHSRCAGEIEKAQAPNRNGILHGDPKHLDYGTYINSCKAICFLSSVMWLSEHYRESKT